MTTPICDFVRNYADSGTIRLHMPGHKGVALTGHERLDLTEIAGADSLYEADGIIAESEANASTLFGCPTFYSTEGSSQCIRAMLYLAMLAGGSRKGRRMRVLAGRNAHKTFLSAAALLDFDVDWICGGESYLACRITPEALDTALAEAGREAPADAVYLTSPDYLGNTADIAALAAVCHRHGALLIVDNAHGAYLRFLPESRHPIDRGADMCCDSAHKTLPALTGAAYLHLSPTLPREFAANAKRALAMFGSTSPSYLILQSLDALNAHLAGEYPARMAALCEKIAAMKTRLSAIGWRFAGDEPMKLTIDAKASGHTGGALADALRAHRIECEFADPDYLVLMPTPASDDLDAAEAALAAIGARAPMDAPPPRLVLPERVLSVREAAFSPAEEIPARESAGRILAAATVGCPPAVPIVVSGERIGADAVRCFEYYGIETCVVVME